MPWTEDNTGKTYKPSIFAKEELPAWSEIIDEYYEKIFLAGDHRFNAADPGELDKYWKVPHKKYIIAMICNQFNKMILEDGFKDDLLKYINSTIFTKRFNDRGVAFNVNFIMRIVPNLGMDDKLSLHERKLLEDAKFKNPEILAAIANSSPYIYSVKNPNGTENLFTTNHPRIYLDSITEDLCLYPAIKVYSTKKVFRDNYLLYTPLPWIEEDVEVYKGIIEWMMVPYKEYFGGSEPGWKDENGNIIEFKRPVVGYDPAL